MRTDNTIKNLISGVSLTLVMTLLGFVTRKLFVDSIGVEYLGLNGLLTNILSVVSLLEAGFGTSIVYNLYKPLANKDESRVIALIQLYKKIYQYIGIGVLLMGLSIYPFLDVFIKDGNSLQYISIVYFIFLFNSLLPYLTAYKWSLINADQKQYKLITINVIYQVGLNLTKLAILYYTKNYILYLIVESIFGIMLNIAVIRKVNKLYPYILTKIKHQIDPKTKQTLISNSKALFLHSLGGYFAHSTDNIIISSFVSISAVGLYSNYTLITSYVNGIVSQILNSFSESVGNLIATESAQRIYDIFKTIFLLNFIVISIPVIILANTLNPFIIWWLGSQYQLDNATILVILLNFFIFGIRTSALTFKVKSGIFRQDRFTPLLQGLINLVLSLIFVQFWGITGVLLGTTVSVLSIGFWQFPRLIYKHAFKQPLKKYFIMYAKYSIITSLAFLGSYLTCNLLSDNSIWSIIIRGIISLIIPIVIYYITLYKTTAMKQLLFTYIKPIMMKFFNF